MRHQSSSAFAVLVLTGKGRVGARHPDRRKVGEGGRCAAGGAGVALDRRGPFDPSAAPRESIRGTSGFTEMKTRTRNVWAGARSGLLHRRDVKPDCSGPLPRPMRLLLNTTINRSRGGGKENFGRLRAVRS